MTAVPPGDDIDEATRREDGRWRYALENAEDGLWDWSAVTDRVYRSPRCHTMLGYGVDEVGDTLEAWRALLHPDDQARQQQAIADHLRGGSGNYKVEYRLRDATGNWRWILDRGKVIHWSADGRPVRVIGTHTDISGYKELEQRLRERERLLAEAQRVCHIGSWALDTATNEVWWSPEMFHIAGWPEGQSVPSWEQQRALYLPESYARLSDAVARALRDGVGYAMDVELQRPDGDRRALEVVAEVIRDDLGSIERLVGAVHDVTDERLATAAARWRNKLLDRIASVGRIGGFDMDVDTGAVQWTDENYRIHGVDPATPVVLEELLERYDDSSRRRLLEALARLQTGSSREESVEAQYVTVDGRRLVLRITANIEDEPGSRRRITGLTQDITEEREAGERIEQLAHFDTLTGLPNRFLFRQRAVEAIRVAQRAQLTLGLLFVDLDRFKYVNDTLGHAVGDLLLQEVSGRLKACLRGSDLIGRQGGDEFMVMLCEMRKPEDAAIVAEKIIAAVGVPITLGDVEVQVGCSIGIALLSDNNPDMESLMRASDTAMYAAKEAGRNTFQFYNDSFYERVHRRGLLEQELHAF